MADFSHADDDQEILNFVDENIDEVDGAKLIEIIDEKSLPCVFCRENDHHLPVIREKTLEYRLVHDRWGNKLAPRVNAFGLYTLIHLKSPLHSAAEAEQMVKQLKHVTRTKLCGIRWSTYYLFAYLPNADDYDEIGEAFANKSLDKNVDVVIDLIQPAMRTDPPRVFLETESGNCDEISDVVSPLVLPFSGCFQYLRLRQLPPDELTASDGGATPLHSAICIGLLFDGSHQSLALKSLAGVSQSGWRRLTLSDGIARVIDDGLAYFAHSRLSLPLISIKTAAPAPGVQFTVFVRDRERFDEMVRFYRAIVRGEPLERNESDVGLRYSTFALSRVSELRVAYYPGLSLPPVSSVGRSTLYVKTVAVPNVPGLMHVAPGFSETHDPEGNRVVLFEMIK